MGCLLFCFCLRGLFSGGASEYGVTAYGNPAADPGNPVKFPIMIPQKPISGYEAPEGESGEDSGTGEIIRDIRPAEYSPQGSPTRGQPRFSEMSFYTGFRDLPDGRTEKKTLFLFQVPKDLAAVEEFGNFFRGEVAVVFVADFY